MGIIKFLKWLADDDPIKEQKSMVDAAKFEVERLKRNIEDVKRGSNSASTLKELRQKLKQARERLAYEKERLKRLKNKGKFEDSFKRQVRRDTGKFVSNLIFGNKHATPIRIRKS